jgi:RNA polymerase sigma-70 factor (ECF subfamily)
MSSSADRGEPVSDEELLRRYLGGEAEAFRPLIQRYEKPIYNFILRSVRRPDRAEEILQDTFLKVVQRAHDFKGQSKFSTWLFTIARNLCIDHSRKMVFRRHRSLDARTDAGEGPTLLDRTANRDAAVDRRAMAADLQARIAEAVEDLPEEQREVFLLREVRRDALQGDRRGRRCAREHREEPHALRAGAPPAGAVPVRGARARAHHRLTPRR